MLSREGRGVDLRGSQLVCRAGLLDRGTGSKPRTYSCSARKERPTKQRVGRLVQQLAPAYLPLWPVRRQIMPAGNRLKPKAICSTWTTCVQANKPQHHDVRQEVFDFLIWASGAALFAYCSSWTAKTAKTAKKQQKPARNGLNLNLGPYETWT